MFLAQNRNDFVQRTNANPVVARVRVLLGCYGLGFLSFAGANMAQCSSSYLLLTPYVLVGHSLLEGFLQPCRPFFFLLVQCICAAKPATMAAERVNGNRKLKRNVFLELARSRGSESISCTFGCWQMEHGLAIRHSPGILVRNFSSSTASELEVTVTAYLEEFNPPFHLRIPAQGAGVAGQELSGAFQGPQRVKVVESVHRLPIHHVN